VFLEASQKANAMQEVSRRMEGLHAAILGVLAEAELDAASRQRLARAAKRALQLSQEISRLQTQAALDAEEQGLLKRVWDFLTAWVTRLPGL